MASVIEKSEMLRKILNQSGSGLLLSRENIHYRKGLTKYKNQGEQEKSNNYIPLNFKQQYQSHQNLSNYQQFSGVNSLSNSRRGSHRQTHSQSGIQKSNFQQSTQSQQNSQQNEILQTQDLKTEVASGLGAQNRLNSINNSQNQEKSGQDQFQFYFSRSSNMYNNFNSNKNKSQMSSQQNQSQIINTQYLERLIEKVNDLAVNLTETYISKDETEFIKLQESISSILLELKSTSKTELELTIKKSEIQKLQQEIVSLKKKSDQQNQRIEQQQAQIDKMQKIRKDLLEDQNKNVRVMNNEKKNVDDHKKKIQSLEKRLDFIIDNDYASFIDGHYQRAMAELVQEHDNQKKTIEKQNKEIVRLQDIILKLNSKLSRLNYKIEQMKRKISAKDLETLNEDQPNENKAKRSGSGNGVASKFEDFENEIFLNRELEQNLEFRLQQLKVDQQNLLSEIQELGIPNFTSFIQKNFNQKQLQEFLQMIILQFKSFREIGDSLTQLINFFIKINQMQDLNEIIQFVQENLKLIFQSDTSNIWIIDKEQSVYYTNKQGSLSDQQIRAVYGKGILSEVEKTQQIRKTGDPETGEKIMYYQTNEQIIQQNQIKKVESFLCFPLYRENTLVGILEISNINKNNKQDEEFLGSFAAKFLNTQFQRLIDLRSIKIELKYKDLFQQSFIELASSQTHFEFTTKMQEWIPKIFGSDIFTLIFVDKANQKFKKYERNTEKMYEFNQGLAGLSYKQQRPLNVENLKSSVNYDSSIDVFSLSPVYIIPIKTKQFENEEVIAIFEIISKKKFKINVNHDHLLLGATPFEGIDDSFDRILNKFCSLLTNAIIIFQRNSHNLK